MSKKKLKIIIGCGILAIIIVILILLLTNKSKPITLKVEFSSNSVKINETVSVIVTPSKTIENPVYSFKVSDEVKASINSSGVLTAKAQGKVKVSVTTTIKKKIITGTSDDLDIIKADTYLSSISIDSPDSVIEIGASETLVVHYNPTNAIDKILNYVSSNPTVLTVDNTGKITGIAIGSATITITSATNPTISTISDVIYVGINYSATFLDYSPTVNVGESSPITFLFFPAETTYQDVTYSSSNPDVLTVDEYGVITGVSIGTAKVIITSSYYHDTWETQYIEVESILESISLVSPSSLGIGEDDDVIVTYNPVTASLKDVTFTSSNTSILTVDNLGHIVGVSEGTATVSVQSNYYATIVEETTVINVYAPLVSLSISASSLIDVGDSELLNVSYTPSNLFNRSVSYQSSDPTVLTVDSNGEITAVKEGTARVTVTSTKNPLISSTSEDITVYLGLESLSLNVSRRLAIGGQLQVTVNYSPSNATYKNVVFVTNAGLILSVSPSGLVTGLSEGITTIYVYSEFDPSINVEKEISVFNQEYIDALQFVEDYYRYNLLLPALYTQIQLDMDSEVDSDGFTEELLAELDGLIDRDTSLLYSAANLETMKTFVKASASSLLEATSDAAYTKLLLNQYLTPETQEILVDHLDHTYVIKVENTMVTTADPFTSETKYVIVYLDGSYFQIYEILNARPIMDRHGFYDYFSSKIRESPNGLEVKKVTIVKDPGWSPPREPNEKDTALYRVTRTYIDDSFDYFYLETGYDFLIGYRVRGIFEPVSYPYDTTPPFTEIYGSAGESTITVGQSTTITVTYDEEDLDEQYKGASFESSDESIITVDKNGVVTAIAEGSATIYVYSTYNDASCSVPFTVLAGS